MIVVVLHMNTYKLLYALEYSKSIKKVANRGKEEVATTLWVDHLFGNFS